MSDNEPADADLTVYDDNVTATTWIDGVLTRYGYDGQEIEEQEP